VIRAGKRRGKVLPKGSKVKLVVSSGNSNSAQEKPKDAH